MTKTATPAARSTTAPPAPSPVAAARAGSAPSGTHRAVIPLLSVHRGLRRDSAALAAAVRALDRTDSTGARRLARATAVFTHLLHEHHDGEDTVVWPWLVARRPLLAVVTEVLEADHAELTPLLARIPGDLAVLGSTGATGGVRLAAHRRLVVDTTLLRDLLGVHLDREEAAVLPVVHEAFTGAEVEALHDVVRRRGSLADVAVGLPWIVGAATDADRPHLLAGVPAPMRAVLRLVWAPRLRRTLAPLAAHEPRQVAAAGR